MTCFKKIIFHSLYELTLVALTQSIGSLIQIVITLISGCAHERSIEWAERRFPASHGRGQGVADGRRWPMLWKSLALDG